MRLLLAAPAALVATLCAPAAAHAGDRFDPPSTYAVVVGVLHWRDPAFTTFPPEARKDRELYETLGRRGVPAAQRVLLLDEDATTAHALAAIEKLAAAAPAGSTFLFYYAGHGGPSESGSDTDLVSYDATASDLDGTGLRVSAITSALAGFRGSRVILMGDACYTGGLAAAATALAARHIEAVSLTSATASDTSTSSWTFTQTIIDALSGRSELDLDGDGAIDLGELDAAVADEMLHRENQAHGYANHGVPAHLIVADARPAPARLESGTAGFMRGDWIRATGPHGSLETAKVLGARAGKLLVSFYDYATETQSWIAPPAIAELPPRTAPPAGADVSVEWHGQWWDANLVSKRGDRSCIHYVGYAASWDECVEPARIKPR